MVRNTAAAPALTDSERAKLENYLGALETEKVGYQTRELPDRVKQVDVEIARVRKQLGAKAAKVETATGSDSTGELETA